ncbi:MAG: hypothetical protein DMF71_12530 [Acidobacteria bacterium]|nr:MAG: hypothetical protein DMF71_12530 [Acidobacteriota bacterium]
MTPDDAQIDILLRRYAPRAESSPAHQHLDADELNAFAEGAVPAETRSRYVSHLADCSDCRRLVSQLAIASGASILASSAAPLETRNRGGRELRPFSGPQLCAMRPSHWFWWPPGRQSLW